MRRVTSSPFFLALLMAVASSPLQAETRMAYDAEPNDALHQAVELSLPTGRERLRIIGELAGEDQDSYRLIVDEDRAGQRLDIALIGRGGALTRLDIFDLTEQADGSGRLPEVFERRPERLTGLASQDGARAVRLDA
ncbi:MAG: hypothetical protein AAGJ52_08170, partial [Pseudomonadota bacterium]